MSFGSQLKQWRKANFIKQHALAETLGVTQAAVSRWESGIDSPSKIMRGRIKDLIMGCAADEARLELMMLRMQVGFRSLVEADGLRFMGMSPKLCRTWPDFEARTGQFLEHYCVNEAAELFGNATIRQEMMSGQIAFICGISDRHLSVEEGEPFRHHWTARFYRSGTKRYIELAMEPAAPDEQVGINEIIRADS